MYRQTDRRTDSQTDGQTDGWTHELIWGGLGNLRFLQVHSLRVGWRNLVRVSLIFAIIVSFMLFTVFPLVYVLYFEEFLIHDSHGFMILKNN